MIAILPTVLWDILLFRDVHNELSTDAVKREAYE